MKYEEKNNNNIKLITTGILILVALVVSMFCFEIVTIKGNELGIKETWSKGVVEDIMQPGTYFLFPGWSQRVINYDASSQVFVMNDKEEESGKGRRNDSYLVQSMEGQDMHISMNLRWRIDPAKLVSIHKTVRHDIEEKIIRPVLMRIVKDKATRKKAIEAYSGEGLVVLQNEIQNSLAGRDASESKELNERGIIVENFVIEHIALDPKYIEEIKGKQIATQKTLRAVEEERAAMAEAEVAKAKAQADLNTKVVAAERDAKVMTLGAQAENEKVIIAAKADQQKQTLEAEGRKAAMIATAEGTLAMGKAEAASKELMLKSYMAAGTNAYVQVEVAKAVAEAFKGIQGYLPENMNITTLSRGFVDAVGNIMGRETTVTNR
jgi:regulator of protease activity HflC (stomatin/prohibitin superfamily)